MFVVDGDGKREAGAETAAWRSNDGSSANKDCICCNCRALVVEFIKVASIGFNISFEEF